MKQERVAKVAANPAQETQPLLPALSLEEYRQKIETTRGKEVEVTNVRGGKTIGVNLGFPTYDRATFLGDSVVLDIEVDEGTSRATIPRQNVSMIQPSGGEVIEFPKH